MKTVKDRRGSGRRFARSEVPAKVMKEEHLEEVEYWDDWDDHRDGYRDVTDRSLIRPLKYFDKQTIAKDNEKNKLLLKRRQVMRRLGG